MSPQIQDIDRLIKDVPAMPVVAQKAMQIMGDPRTNNAQLAETLSSDPALASRILQMANSPFFGTRQRIATLNNAIFVMGHSALRSLIITVCTKGLFKDPGLTEEKLWEHCLGSAIIARGLAELTVMHDPDESFMGALLHDIGQVSLAVVYPEEYHALFERDFNSGSTMDEHLEVEMTEFGYDHCQIGSRVLLKWRLPEEFSRVARRHHTNNPEVVMNEEASALLAIVGLSNIIAARVGFGFKEPDKRVDVVNTIFHPILQIGKIETIKVIEDSLKTYKETRQQFNLT